MLNWRSTIYALIGAIFSAIVFAAIAVALSPIGMPALTAPFVLTTPTCSCCRRPVSEHCSSESRRRGARSRRSAEASQLTATGSAEGKDKEAVAFRRFDAKPVLAAQER